MIATHPPPSLHTYLSDGNTWLYMRGAVYIKMRFARIAYQHTVAIFACPTLGVCEGQSCR